MPKRRHLLIAGTGVAAWVAAFQAGPGLLSRFGGPSYEPFDRVEGFRVLAGGETSTPAFDFTLGLGPRNPVPPEVAEAVARAPSEALFPPGEMSEGDVPAAYFFDYYCPYCRTLSGYLDDLAASAGLAVVHQHWPIFGAASELAARATLAAERQGGGNAMHDRLMGTAVRVTPPYIESLAVEAGLSWPTLARDMDGAAVTLALDRARALARLFGFAGTPSLVVGRTVLEGEVGEARLRQVVQDERSG